MNVTHSDDDMNISQEILVLDFGDENRDFFKSDPSSDYNGRFIISYLKLFFLKYLSFLFKTKLSP